MYNLDNIKIVHTKLLPQLMDTGVSTESGQSVQPHVEEGNSSELGVVTIQHLSTGVISVRATSHRLFSVILNLAKVRDYL